jgi:hypothetical protein
MEEELHAKDVQKEKEEQQLIERDIDDFEEFEIQSFFYFI